MQVTSTTSQLHEHTAPPAPFPPPPEAHPRWPKDPCVANASGAACLLWSCPFPSGVAPFSARMWATLGRRALSLTPALLCPPKVSFAAASRIPGACSQAVRLSGWPGRAHGREGGLTLCVVVRRGLASSVIPLVNFSLGRMGWGGGAEISSLNWNRMFFREKRYSYTTSPNI